MFNQFIYNPLYNALVGIIDITPGGHVFWGVVILTVVVKLILLPLTKKSIITQIKSRYLQEDMKELKEKYKDNRELMGMKTLELYKKHKINPFTPILLLIIQIPIILALFFVFSRGGLPIIHTEVLYSFIPTPENVNMEFLGVNLGEKSLVFAFLAALTQHLYMKRVLVMPKKKDEKDEKETKTTEDVMENITKAMNTQMLYILPVIIFFAGYGFSAVVALYWTISNIFTYAQDVYVKSHAKKLGILEQ